MLCFTGCGNKEEEVMPDQATMEQVADVIIATFAVEKETAESLMGLSEFGLSYQLMYLPIDAENFSTMYEAWQAAEDECGAYISNDEYVFEAKGDEYTLSTEAKFEDRDATILFTFNKEQRLESVDVSAKYSMGEILQKAGLNTILGMGTVFAVLIFLAFIISCMKYIPVAMEWIQKRGKKAEESSAVVEASEETTEEVDDLELVAVITAAIAAQEGTGTDDFVVRSIRRRPSNNWN